LFETGKEETKSFPFEVDLLTGNGKEGGTFSFTQRERVQSFSFLFRFSFFRSLFFFFKKEKKT